MNKRVLQFLYDEEGAISVDFVVLTAGICLLGFLVVTAFSGSTTNVANEIEVALDDIDL
jgi:Flp pilus assembly pilin Flp